MVNRNGYDFLQPLHEQFVLLRALEIAIYSLESGPHQCELRTLARVMKYLQESIFPMCKMK